MNLYTYLRIKQAAGPRYASDATPEEIAEWAGNELAGQNALKQVSELQSQLDEAIGKNNRYYFDNEKNEANWKDYMASANAERDKAVADAIKQQQEKYDANEANWQNYMVDAVKEQNRLNTTNQALAKKLLSQQESLANLQSSYDTARERAKKVLAQKDQQINELYGRSADFESQLGAANKSLLSKDQTIGELQTHANSLADQIGNANKSMDRMRRNASIGGAVGGAAIGGGLGYAGSKWLNKKLKLTGRKALVAKLLGTAAGSALGGTGGYYLGRNI